MSIPRVHHVRALTLAEYRRLEAEGRIARPLTDHAIGATTDGKRSADATASAVHADPVSWFVPGWKRTARQRFDAWRSACDSVRKDHE